MKHASITSQRAPFPRFFSSLRRRWRLVLALLLFTALLVCSLIHQATNDFRAHSFAQSERRVLTGTRDLHMTYPARLFATASDTQGKPLVAWISDTDVITTTDVYTVTFVHEGGLWFTDADGQTVPARMVLPVSPAAAYQQQIYVRPAPLLDQAPRSLNVQLLVSPPVSGTIDPISIEVVPGSWWSFLIDRLLLDIALPLSLAIAVIGWVLDHQKMQREQQEKERQSRLQSLQDQFQAIDKMALADSAEAARHLYSLEQQLIRLEAEEKRAIFGRVNGGRNRLRPGKAIRETELPSLQDYSALQIEIRGLWSKLQQDLACQTHFLVHIGETFLHLNRASLMDVRTSPSYRILQKLLGADQEKHVDTLYELFLWGSTHPLSEPASVIRKPAPGAVVEAVVWLWNTYDRAIHELLVQALLLVIHAPPEERIRVIQTIQTPLIEKASGLLSDVRLQAIGPVPRSYIFASGWQPSVISPLSDVDRWIEGSILISNPFVPGIRGANPLLPLSWIDPVAWHSVTAPQPTITTSVVREDREAATLMLYAHFQAEKDQKVFPVRVSLPLATVWRGASHDVLLSRLVRAVGQTLLAMLPDNPMLLLDCMPDVQGKIVRLLTWVAGSRDALCQHISTIQSGVAPANEPDPQRPALVEQVRQKLVQIVDQSLGHVQQIDTPAPRLLQAWLALRPPGLQSTFFIVDVDDAGPDTQAQAAALLSLAHTLQQRQVIVKVCAAPEAIGVTYGIASLPIEWQPEDLQKMVQARIYHASAYAFDTLNACFGPMPLFDAHGHSIDADELLAAHADRSLGTMLQLGRALFEHHAAQSPAEPYLDQDDLETVLNEIQGDT